MVFYLFPVSEGCTRAIFENSWKTVNICKTCFSAIPVMLILLSIIRAGAADILIRSIYCEAS